MGVSVFLPMLHPRSTPSCPRQVVHRGVETPGWQYRCVDDGAVFRQAETRGAPLLL